MFELIILCALGFAGHILKKIIETSDSPFGGDWLKRLTTYFVGAPFVTIFAAIGAVAGFMVADAFNQLNEVSAFAIGYLAESLPNIIKDRASLT